jgi:hypothetical protein
MGGGFRVGLMTGGTITGGTITGGTVTGGTVTGGTVTGGTITGGTATGGTTTVTGGTLTGSGTAIVTVPGFDPVGGSFEPVLGVGVVAATDVEGAGGVGVTAGVVGVMTVVVAGLADGVGLLVAECCFGTTISGLPPPAGGVEPKYEPATG